MSRKNQYLERYGRPVSRISGVVERPVTQLRLHPLADIVPRMRPEEWTAFLSDVKERGILTPVELAPDGVTVLDGRHRLEAARACGLDLIPTCAADLQGLSELEYMLRAALFRRHLSDDQRAVIATELAEIMAASIRKRRASAAARARWAQRRSRFGYQADVRADRHDVPQSVPSPLRSDIEADLAGMARALAEGDPTGGQGLAAGTRLDAAGHSAELRALELLNVSHYKLKQARRLERLAPDLVPAVASGQRSLRDAYREAVKRVRTPDTTQRLRRAVRRALDAAQGLRVVATSLPAPERAAAEAAATAIEHACAPLRAMLAGDGRPRA